MHSERAAALLTPLQSASPCNPLYNRPLQLALNLTRMNVQLLKMHALGSKGTGAQACDERATACSNNGNKRIYFNCSCVHAFVVIIIIISAATVFIKLQDKGRI